MVFSNDSIKTLLEYRKKGNIEVDELLSSIDLSDFLDQLWEEIFEIHPMAKTPTSSLLKAKDCQSKEWLNLIKTRFESSNLAVFTRNEMLSFWEDGKFVQIQVSAELLHSLFST